MGFAFNGQGELLLKDFFSSKFSGENQYARKKTPKLKKVLGGLLPVSCSKILLKILLASIRHRINVGLGLH